MILKGKLVHQGIEVPDPSRSYCGSAAKQPQVISFDEIIWAETVGNAINLSYIQLNADKTKGELRMTRLRIEDEEPQSGASPPVYILNEAYADSKRQKRLYVIVNPHSGPGHARKLYHDHAEKLLKAGRCEITLQTSNYIGHAEELMKDLDIEQYDAIVCVSGDGLPHEVMNGLAKRPDGAHILATTPICQLPGGSGNAMCYSLNGTVDVSVACLNIIKGVAMPTDLMAITQRNRPTRYSFLSQSWGIVADCDLGTDSWRWMGSFRFELGLLIKLISGNTYPCKISYKLACPEERKSVIAYFSENKASGISQKLDEHSLDLKYGTVDDQIPQDWTVETHRDMVNFYVGNMPWMSSDAIVFPYTLPQDGAMDMITWDSDVKFFEGLQRFIAMTKATHVNNPRLIYRKVVAYRLEPLSEHYLSVDGESYPCEQFQVELLPRAGCILSRGDYAAVP